MIKTTQKVITIGSSQGVTIPKKELQRLGIKVGDSVEISVQPEKTKLGDLVGRLDSFMATYDADLKNLTKR